MITQLRTTTITVVEAIRAWMSRSGRRGFGWKGRNYVLKLCSDTWHLAARGEPMQFLLGMDPRANPLLMPGLSLVPAPIFSRGQPLLSFYQRPPAVSELGAYTGTGPEACAKGTRVEEPPAPSSTAVVSAASPQSALALLGPVPTTPHRLSVNAYARLEPMGMPPTPVPLSLPPGWMDG